MRKSDSIARPAPVPVPEPAPVSFRSRPRPPSAAAPTPGFRGSSCRASFTAAAREKTSLDERGLALARRELFQRVGTGIGSIALAALLGRDLRAAGETAAKADGASFLPHLAPRATNVIYLHMVGAPSHLDLLENKPRLRELHEKPCPERLLTEGQQFAFIRGRPRLKGSEFAFHRHGKSGIELSELLPHLGGVADDLCVVKSLHTEEFNHAPAQLFYATGFARHGRPSLGSWVSYGLGSENDDLPAFVVLITGGIAGAGSALWGSGFLPSAHQGVELRTRGDPVLFLSDPRGIRRRDRRRIIDSVNLLNEIRLADVGDPEIAARIAQYELAYRMQSSVPGLMDISEEPVRIHELYGTTPGKASFANNCLLARRLVERGVRFVQLYDQGWDHHSNLAKGLPRKCAEIDRPAAALIRDLKQRGLLDRTLVVWGGEFGRTPVLQGKDGRDHHKDAFAFWMAGGGVRGGMTHGATDELGFRITEDPAHVNDLHATILHLLGIDHERLTYRFQGRDFRLTDVGGRVVREVLT